MECECKLTSQIEFGKISIVCIFVVVKFCCEQKNRLNFLYNHVSHFKSVVYYHTITIIKNNVGSKMRRTRIFFVFSLCSICILS